jgi:uncharacterized membrane protein YccC
VLAAAWARRRIAAGATLCIGIPLVVLCALGEPTSAAVATQGAFAGFYAFDAPLRRRARVVAGIGVALAAAMVLGTLAAPSPVAVALVGGIVAFGAALCCVALEIGPPRE